MKKKFPAFYRAPHELIKPEDLGVLMPIFGGMPQGFNVEADVITQTIDGRPLNDLWTEFTEVVRIHNERRQILIDLLTFPVQQLIEDVPALTGDDFEEASEFGVPVGVRTTMTYFQMAYDFKWYDVATRYTWKFLAEATASQIEAIHQGVLEADNRLIFRKVMNTLFRNTNRAATINGANYNVFALYNGDGTIPPEYKTNTFNGTHTHYVTSGAAGIDSGDLDSPTTGLFQMLREHGFGETNGTQLVVMVNPAQGATIRSWRANVANANGAVAVYDFVPATNQPALIVPNAQGLIGQQVGGTWRGLTAIGSYGPAIIVEEEYIPPGYVVILGSGGEGALQNPIGIREHANPNLRGLRLLAGDRTNYPLVNSYYSRGFGTGIRQRGGAAVMQITASATYTIPAQYAN